jgi:hypothetical protein
MQREKYSSVASSGSTFAVLAAVPCCPAMMHLAPLAVCVPTVVEAVTAPASCRHALEGLEHALVAPERLQVDVRPRRPAAEPVSAPPVVSSEWHGTRPGPGRRFLRPALR